MRRKVIHLQSEIHRKAITFFTHEFDAILLKYQVIKRYAVSKFPLRARWC